MIELLEDPEYRIENLYKIVDKKAQTVSLKRNIVQKRISECRAKRKLIIKARQFGVSTSEILELFDYTIWNRNVTTCILAHEKDSIRKLFRIVSRAYRMLDDEVKPKLDRGGGSQYEYFFPDLNSRIYVDLESRGDTLHRLHVSEAAFFKDPDKLLATLQAVPIDAEVTLETTPNGVGNFIYDEWKDPDSIYEKLFFPWFFHKEYKIETQPLEITEEEKEFAAKAIKNYGVDISDGQIAFRRFKQKELKHLFIQEYPEDPNSCFLASGSCPIDGFIISELIDEAKKPIKSENGLEIFTPVDRSRRYVIAADTAEGIDGDYSTAQVLDVQTREQVAFFRDHIKPFDFAHKLAEIAELYKTARNQLPLLAVERNNHGCAVLQELDQHIQYPNLYRREEDGRLGWLTDKVTRPLMIDVFIEALENRSTRFHDKVTLQECLTLVEMNGKIEAGTGYHDDAFIAGCIGLQMCIKEGVSSMYDDIGSYIRV